MLRISLSLAARPCKPASKLLARPSPPFYLPSQLKPFELPRPFSAAASHFDYDLIVIGGGSGGLAASKAAASLGKKVAVLDFVKPTPLGTTWGLGGTCVNVGCIPKKLFHQAALLGTAIKDASSYGWKVSKDNEHSWIELRNAVMDHIKSLNWTYRVALHEAGVKYINAHAKFLDPHTIEATHKNQKIERISAENFIIATGERPHYPEIEGAREYGITSDDVFFLSHPPGKTLVVGASYVGLECAGFLQGLGIDVTLMVRSIFLRGFDQQMASMIAEHLREEGIKILQPCIPTKVKVVQKGSPGLYKVYGKKQDTEEEIGTFNTVLFAIGRDPCTRDMGLEEIGIKLNPKGRVVVNEAEQTSVPNIYAIGDVIDKGIQLTPVAIKAGNLWAQRLYNNSSDLMDYVNVPTTIFTPLEYGCIGYPEERAIEKFGKEDIEVYHLYFQPFEWAILQRGKNQCYVKLICLRSQQEKVIGFHYFGPNAGEVTQGFSVSMRQGVNKADFDRTVGIHPTSAEMFISLFITKRSGLPAIPKGCCG